MEGGTVFANEGGYTYIAYEYQPGTSIYLYGSGNYIPSTSTDFGTGQTNTQTLLDPSITNISASNNQLLYVIQQEINGYSDWFVPSKDELQRVFDFTNVASYSSSYYLTSSQDGCTSSYRIMRPDGSSACAFSNYYSIIVRKIPSERDVLQFDNNSPITVGAFQTFLPQETFVDGDPEIGADYGGGEVFYKDNDYVYVAHELSSTINFDWYATSTSSAFGTGYENTQKILQASSTTSTARIEGLLRQPINGYDDWFIPSSEELLMVFDSTDQGTRTLSWYWTSSTGSCSNGDYTQHTPNGATTCEDYNDYDFLIVVRRIPRETAYTADDNDFVTVGFLLNKIAELEAKIEALTLPAIGSEAGGGIVFAHDGSDVYVAYEYNPGSTYRYNYYNSPASNPITFGSGASNSQKILAESSSTTSTSYIEGILRSTVNGYNDWFIPSIAELQSVFTNTDIGGATSNYYWSSSHDTS
jgi:hypothetical protein